MISVLCMYRFFSGNPRKIGYICRIIIIWCNKYVTIPYINTLLYFFIRSKPYLYQHKKIDGKFNIYAE